MFISLTLPFSHNLFYLPLFSTFISPFYCPFSLSLSFPLNSSFLTSLLLSFPSVFHSLSLSPSPLPPSRSHPPCSLPPPSQVLVEYIQPKDPSNGLQYQKTLLGAVLSVSCLLKTPGVVEGHRYFLNPSSSSPQEMKVQEANIQQVSFLSSGLFSVGLVGSVCWAELSRRCSLLVKIIAITMKVQEILEEQECIWSSD